MGGATAGPRPASPTAMGVSPAAMVAGEDKPSPLPYTGSSSFPNLVVKFHHRATTTKASFIAHIGISALVFVEHVGE
jgi:hypothetical protein